jgi:hypothetical protein
MCPVPVTEASGNEFNLTTTSSPTAAHPTE